MYLLWSFLIFVLLSLQLSRNFLCLTFGLSSSSSTTLTHSTNQEIVTAVLTCGCMCASIIILQGSSSNILLCLTDKWFRLSSELRTIIVILAGIDGDDAYGLPAPDHQQAESRAQCAMEDIVTGEAEKNTL